MKKIYYLIFFLCFSQLSISKEKDISLLEFIVWIQEDQGLHFSYDPDLIKGISVARSFKNLAADELLDALAHATGLTFKESSKDHILIIPRPSVFHVKGKILDAQNKEAIIGAVISNLSKTKAVFSEIDGSFELGKNIASQDTIVISFLGYKTQKIPSYLFHESKTIYLELELNMLNEVVITSYMTHGIQVHDQGQSLEITTKQLTQIPGEPQGDVLQAIQALPGINTANGKAGSFNIRGSSVDQSLVLIDDIPIYYRGHVFGTVSPFNPLIADKITVYRTGPTVNFGGTVGGAVTIQTPKSIIDSSYHAFYASTTSLGAYAEYPIIKNKLSLYLSARTSYPTKWQSPKLSSISSTGMLGTSYSYSSFTDSLIAEDLTYYFGDLNVKLNYQLNEKSLISLSMLSLTDKIVAKSFDNRTNNQEQVNEEFLNQSWGLSLDWKQQLNKQTNVNLKFVRSVFENQNIVLTPQGEPIGDDHHIKQSKLMVNIERNQKIGNQLTFGYEIEPTDILNETINDSIVTEETNQKTVNHALYTSYRIKSLKKLYADLGFRLTYTPFANFFIPEPRLFTSYQLNKQWLLKVSASRHSQLITQTIFFDFDDFNASDRIWILSDRDDQVQVSTQYMTGVFWKKKAWQVDMELYYKNTNNIRSEYNDGVRGITGSTFGNGYSYGLDLMLSRNVRKLSTWINFSYTKTKWSFSRISDEDILAYYDQPITFSINSSYAYKRFVFSAGWNLKSGVPNQTVDTGLARGQVINQNAKIEHHLPGQTTTTPLTPTTDYSYLGRLANFHQLDISAKYNFSKSSKKWKGSIGLSVLNIYNRKNVIELVTEEIFGINDIDRTTVGVAPELYLDLKF